MENLENSEEKIVDISVHNWPCKYKRGHPDLYITDIEGTLFIELSMKGTKYYGGKLIFKSERNPTISIPLMAIEINKLRIEKSKTPIVVKSFFGLRKREVDEYLLIVPFTQGADHHDVIFSSTDVGLLNAALLKIKDYYSRIYDTIAKGYTRQRDQLTRLLNELKEKIAREIENMKATGKPNVSAISEIEVKYDLAKRMKDGLFSDATLNNVMMISHQVYREMQEDKEKINKLFDEVERLHATLIEMCRKLEEAVIAESNRHISEIESIITQLEVEKDTKRLTTLFNSYLKILEQEEEMSKLSNFEIKQVCVRRETGLKERINSLRTRIFTLKKDYESLLEEVTKEKISVLKTEVDKIISEVNAGVINIEDITKKNELDDRVGSLLKELQEFQNFLLTYTHYEIAQRLSSLINSGTRDVRTSLAQQIFAQLSKQIDKFIERHQDDFDLLGLGVRKDV